VGRQGVGLVRRSRSRRSLVMSHAAAAASPDGPIPDRVRQIVADALGRPVTDVAVASSLMEELGAESLDFLDIVFQLEQSFGIEITRGEMERAARGDMSDEDFAPGGVISDAGL